VFEKSMLKTIVAARYYLLVFEIRVYTAELVKGEDYSYLFQKEEAFSKSIFGGV
jgi:hypothetical protein